MITNLNRTQLLRWKFNPNNQTYKDWSWFIIDREASVIYQGHYNFLVFLLNNKTGEKKEERFYQMANVNTLNSYIKMFVKHVYYYDID